MTDFVHVYWNLNRHCWSVRKRGRVVAYCQDVIVHDCRMIIQPGGLARCRQAGVKNVHAYIKGSWLAMEPLWGPWYGITYNPFTMDTFIWRDSGKPILQAAACRFSIIGESRP